MTFSMHVSLLHWLKIAVLGYAPADVAPEFPNLSTRRYSCYLRLLLHAAALQTWQLPEWLPNYTVCILYVPCDGQDKKRVNNSKLRATQHTKKKKGGGGRSAEWGIRNKKQRFFFFWQWNSMIHTEWELLHLRIWDFCSFCYGFSITQ